MFWLSPLLISEFVHTWSTLFKTGGLLLNFPPSNTDVESVRWFPLNLTWHNSCWKSFTRPSDSPLMTDSQLYQIMLYNPGPFVCTHPSEYYWRKSVSEVDCKSRSERTPAVRCHQSDTWRTGVAPTIALQESLVRFSLFPIYLYFKATQNYPEQYSLCQ